MINFQTLENTPITTILDTFNLAFSDYIVPMHLTEEQLNAKIKSENTQLNYSVGAFENNQLIAFILHGYDMIDNKPALYNGGTGVIPSKRGQKLTARLYEFLLPQLHSKGIETVSLEVITTNQPAVITYQKTGFNVRRTLNCYKGTIHSKTSLTGYTVQILKDWDWQQFTSFWDWQPSWQNASSAVEKNKENLVTLGIFGHQELLGYLIFNPKSNRIQQFAVSKTHRNQGLAGQLFSHVAQNYTTEVSMINIDNASTATVSFLEAIGFQKTVAQYEMELKL